MLTIMSCGIAVVSISGNKASINPSKMSNIWFLPFKCLARTSLRWLIDQSRYHASQLCRPYDNIGFILVL